MLHSLQHRLVLIKLWSMILKPDIKCWEILPWQQGLSQVSLLITANKYFNSGTFGRKGRSGALCLVPYEDMTTEICSAWLIFYAEIHWVCGVILVACFLYVCCISNVICNSLVEKQQKEVSLPQDSIGWPLSLLHVIQREQPLNRNWKCFATFKGE